MKIALCIFLFLTLIGPISLILRKQVKFSGDYATANRASANLAPDPKRTREALIQVYAARAFKWRGFAVHTWIATKTANADNYIVYQVVGWRLLRNISTIAINNDIPDRNWFDQKPTIILDIRGQAAADLIPEIEKIAPQFPYPFDYKAWPGPNSNTFMAFLAREIPRLQLALPSNALGKDFLPANKLFAKAPSGTGYQISFYGLFGILLAKKEGLEINLFGCVYGVSPVQFAIKLPALGDLTLLNKAP